MRRSPVLLLGILSLVLAALAAPPIASAQGPQRDTIRLGSVTLQRCGGGLAGYCGSIRRPLDPGLRGGPAIRVGFAWIPARDRQRDKGAIVAVEGGPGFPSSGAAENLEAMFGPQLDDHDLLLFDVRGTGRSALIRCPELQRFPAGGRASGPAFARVVGRCGERLDHTYRGRDGSFVHASDLFGTEYSTADLHALIARLRLGRVQLYGASYGSWFAQMFIARYPGQLRSVILDSTYPVADLDPYYGSSIEVGRSALRRVCERSLACRTAAGDGSPARRLGRLLARLRRQPLRGSVASAAGRQTVAVTPRRLADLLQNAGSEPYPLRELDASVRAALAGDPVPLLRLAAVEDENGGSPDPSFFSNGNYVAVTCTDYPQLYSLQASPPQRARQLRRSIQRAPRRRFAPFEPAEWMEVSSYTEGYDNCLDWPRPTHHQPQPAPVGARRLPASVPLLIIGGDLDDLTPLRDVRRFGPELGRHVRIVDLRNAVHVTSQGFNYLADGAACGRAIIGGFIADPEALDRLDSSCAPRIPPVQTPGAYPRTLRSARPASVESGPSLSRRERRAVTVAAGALADATILQQATGGGRGAGLRGGSWRLSHGTFRFHRVRFVADATVTGTGRYRAADGATSGKLTVVGPGLRVTVALAWDQRSQRASARLGKTRLSLPAP